MASKRQYNCTRCGREIPRDDLRVKRVSFREMGEAGRTIRSRVEAWLCTVPADDGGPSCLEADQAWSAKSHVWLGSFKKDDDDTPAAEDPGYQKRNEHLTNEELQDARREAMTG